MFCQCATYSALVLWFAASPPFEGQSRASWKDVDSTESDRRASLLEEFNSGDSMRAGIALSRLVPERNGTISALIEIAYGRKSESGATPGKYAAVEILGAYRAEQSCPMLVEDIEYSPPGIVMGPHALMWYPAAYSLVQIGEPGIREILTRGIAKPATDKRLKIFAYVIRTVHGQELGQFRIERLFETKKAERGRVARKSGGEVPAGTSEKNLVRLIQIYKTIDPGDIADWPKPSDPQRRNREKKRGHH